jgi:hypothetical protein
MLHNIISIIKSELMRRVGHEAHLGENGDEYKARVGRPEENRSL